jgi:signal transduction histidine kinase/streptogramin lyase
VHGVFPARGGDLWLATEDGIVRIGRDGVERFAAASGVAFAVRVIAEDRDGNLWLGSRGAGLGRIDLAGLVSYTAGDERREITAIVEDRTGRLCVSGVSPDGGRWFGTLENNVLVPFVPDGTERLRYWGWGWGQTFLQDRDGAWWLPTGEGLFRYPAAASCTALARLRPTTIYRRGSGLSADDIFRLFEDSEGNVWISTFDELHRWVRATGRVEDMTEFGRRTPTAFAEDRAGGIWIGFYKGGLARYRRGVVEDFGDADGVPAGFVEALHVDRDGRLWIATRDSGLSRVDSPGDDRPVFSRPLDAEGLMQGAILALAEDRLGQFYAATGRGIIQFDGTLQRMRRLTTADGRASNLVRTALVDRTGALWFGTQQGLSRLVPRLTARPEPPPTLIHALRLAGVPRPIAQLGERDVGHIVLKPAGGRIEIEYGVASLAAGEIVRYQVRLEGADPDWLEPSSARSMVYPNLAPGSYRFLVRAVHADGRVSSQPATVAFTVLPPLWRHGWFVALVLLGLGLAVAVVHRQRVRRLLAIERVRTRVATDLHDDLGARLSRISILAEVARTRLGTAPEGAAQILDEVGATARELIHASSDIAWAVDPAHDDLRSLAVRIRRFASDMLDAQGVAWTFEAPAEGALARLSPEVRRHVLLIFQEAINNIARHAGASGVRLALYVRAHRLEAEIADDGRGFVAAAGSQASADGARGAADAGRGIHNMLSRARDLRGHVRVTSAPGQGTRIHVSIPLR